MGAPELARAVLEGVAYSVRLLMGALEASAGVQATRLRHAGGGARSDVWCQIRADALGRPLDRVASLDSGVVGAAMLAGLSAGAFGSIEEAARRMARVERSVRAESGDEGAPRRGFRPLHGPLRAAQGVFRLRRRLAPPPSDRPSKAKNEFQRSAGPRGSVTSVTEGFAVFF